MKGKKDTELSLLKEMCVSYQLWQLVEVNGRVLGIDRLGLEV